MARHETQVPDPLMRTAAGALHLLNSGSRRRSGGRRRGPRGPVYGVLAVALVSIVLATSTLSALRTDPATGRFDPVAVVTK